MIYADYSYYKDQFHGSLIPEAEFEYRSARASEYLDWATFGRISEELMESDTAAALKIRSCCCAVAEADHSYEKIAGKTSEKIGSYSVSYAERTDEAKNNALYRLVDMYLGNTGLLFRGV